MIERYLTIKNFRSIGVTELQHFDMNYLMDNKGSYGGLITIIGENNSGKSNVLDAIKAFGSGQFDISNDYPFHSQLDDMEPQVGLYLKNNKSKEEAVVKLCGNKYYFNFLKNKKSSVKLPSAKLSKTSEELVTYLFADSIIKIIKQNSRTLNAFNSISDILLKFGKKEIITEAEFNTLNSNIRNPYLLQAYKGIYGEHELDVFIEDVRANFVSNTVLDIKNKVNEDSLANFNVKALPNVVSYMDSNKIKSSDTISNVVGGKIENPSFFTKLFELIEGREYSELKKAYEQFYVSGQQRISILTNYSKKINNSLELLSSQFNKIYSFSKTNKYTFRLRLESNKIFLMINENGYDIHLDAQSTGFKWFFDFFFNVFADKQLENGDIVILDEPATNLHVAGQIELRKQIKDFGMSSGITFVMCTHSPFLIDPDFLDEVRVVTKIGMDSKIQNKFTVNNKSNLDVMMPIKTALTVNRHILIDPRNYLVFVEGITDYNYFVMVKNLLKLDNITFMPIQGIKRPSLYEDLLKITQNPVMIVDSDGAGKYVYSKFNGKGMEVIRLEDFEPKFIEIENLFNASEITRFEVFKKDYKISSALKNNVIYKKTKISSETKGNFNTIFDRILDK